MRESKTLIMDTRIHATLKYLSSFNQRSMSDELEAALEQHFKQYNDIIQFFLSRRENNDVSTDSTANENGGA